MPNRTPGDWQAGTQEDGGLVYAWMDGRPVAIVADTDQEDIPPEEVEANARLAAAAPDLLDALVGLCDWVETVDADSSIYVADALNKSRAAIAKAGS